jgi:DNA primase
MSYNIVFLLDSVLGPHKQFAKSEHYYFCPFCNHYNPKLAVNINKRAWHCWKCNIKGKSLVGLLRKLHASREDIAEMEKLVGEYVVSTPNKRPDETLIKLPDEFVPLWEVSTDFECAAAKRYLRRRNILEAEIYRYQIGFCSVGPYAHRIIIPNYDERGLLNYFVARDYFETSSSKYLNPSVSKNVVGFENQINWSYPIILVEGVFDAMAIKRNAIPLLGSPEFIPKKLQEQIIKRTNKEIYLALDKDALKKTLKFAEKFMKEGLTVYLVKLPIADPSSIGFEQMHKLIQQTSPLTFKDLVQLRLSV